mmetsp:Transcript_15593/g.34778  ORF Transcript_15593/g.34778 Transcript_15593/m.34778 type:complete len:314 (+) Transcript_15593:3222-4163(+)
MKKVKGKNTAAGDALTTTASSSPCCFDDGDGSRADTETSPSSSSSIQLSLPDSFDDTLDLSIVLDAETKGQHKMSGGGSCSSAGGSGSSSSVNHPVSRPCPVHQHLQPQSRTEIKILRSKLQEAAATIKALHLQIQVEKSSIQDAEVLDDAECRYLSRLPPQELTLAQFAALKSQIINLKEKGRRYDAACQRATEVEAAMDELRKRNQTHATEMEQCSTKETDLRQKILEYEKRVQILDMDKSYLQKENAILLGRAEESEKTASEQASTLREALTKSNALESELVKERDASKASYDDKLLIEMDLDRDTTQWY